MIFVAKIEFCWNKHKTVYHLFLWKRNPRSFKNNIKELDFLVWFVGCEPNCLYLCRKCPQSSDFVYQMFLLLSFLLSSWCLLEYLREYISRPYTVLADNNIQRYKNIIDNLWGKLTPKIWKLVVKEYKLESDWWEFTPNKLDTRCKDWTAIGITAICNIMNDETLIVFQNT